MKISRAEEDEEERIIEDFTRQLKTSGYDRKKSREIIVAGILGVIRKRRRREEQGSSFYRGAASTLKTRIRKKLLDPVNWFKTKDWQQKLGPGLRKHPLEPGCQCCTTPAGPLLFQGCSPVKHSGVILARIGTIA